jgi:hypothetical protein
MNKAPRELQEEDIVALVRLRRAEGPMLEYKRDLYEPNERGSKEFLLDVCSMANSLGGYLFVGISEQRENGQATGVPDPDVPPGLEVANPEQILAEYEARILDCIDERLLIESHAIPLATGRYVLAFRIPNSLSKPHRVHYRGHSYFHARRERQRYPLTATEIKDLVMRTASRLEMAEAQLQAALSRPTANDQAPTLTIAVVPVFTRNYAVDFRRAQIVDALARLDLTAQRQQVRREPTYSVDGLTRTGPAGALITLGHSGLIRLVVELPSAGVNGGQSFNPIVIDMYVRGIASGCGSIYTAAGLTAPVLFGLALRISTQCFKSYGRFGDDLAVVNPFSKIYPSLTLDSFTDRIESQIRPICDLAHQSLGEVNSTAFDAGDNWRGPR